MLVAAFFTFGLLALPLVRGEVQLADDLGDFHLPLRIFYASCLAHGESFRWWSDLYCGFDVHGEGQVGLYHPWHLLLYSSLPVTMAFELEVLASYPALLAGAYLCLRRWALPRDAALFGAFACTFSGFNLYHFKHPNAVGVIAHLPWLLLAADSMLCSRSPGRTAWARLAVTLLTTSQVLLGHPQSVVFSCLVEVFVVAALIRNQGGRLGSALTWAAAKLLGALGSSLQLLPTWDAVQHSIRVRTTRQFVAMGSLHPANLLQPLAPYLYSPRVFGPGFRLPDHAGVQDAALSLDDWRSHEFGNYCGSAAPPLLIWLWLRRHDLGRYRRLAGLALILGVTALVLALGKYTPLFDLYWRLPIVRLFRIPARYVLLVHLATAVLAAIAIAELGRLRRPSAHGSWRAYWALAIIPISSVIVALAVPLTARHWPAALLAQALAAPPALLVGPALASLAAILVTLSARGSRPGLAALIAFAGIDQACFSLTYVRSYPHGNLLTAARLDPLPPGAARHPHIQFPDPRRNALTLRGARLITGYSGLIPARQLDYRKMADLRAAGAEWIGERLPDRSVHWTPVTDPMPRARLVTRILATANPARDVESIDLATTALAERPLGCMGREPGSATVLVDKPGRIVVHTNGSSRQMLVLTERFHEGWRASLDGRSCPVMRVNGDFLGCVVDRGDHTIRLEFDPASFRIGLRLSAAVLGLTILWLAVGLWTAHWRLHST